MLLRRLARRSLSWLSARRKQSTPPPHYPSEKLITRSRPSVSACGSDISFMPVRVPVELERGVFTTLSPPPRSTARSASLRLDCPHPAMKEVVKAIPPDTTLLPKADSPPASWRLDWGGERRRCPADGRRGVISEQITTTPASSTAHLRDSAAVRQIALAWLSLESTGYSVTVVSLMTWTTVSSAPKVELGPPI